MKIPRHASERRSDQAAAAAAAAAGREGRDDGVKMAARVRVPLPLRGQENIQGTNESETRRRISWQSLTEITPFFDDVAAA